MPRTPKTKSARAPSAPRVRRTADEARKAILDATELRLIEAGPAGIRLQEVAKDVGMTHSTVLHHFGSREALVKAVCARSFEAINAQIVTAIGQSAGAEGQVASMLDGVATALSTHGHGRVVMWLALEGLALDGADVRLAAVAGATHELRRKRRKPGTRAPSLEDTTYTVVLAAMALLAESIVGPALLADAGLDERAGPRFRAWLARLLVAHLDQ